MQNQKQTHKLPEKEFRQILAANNYNFAFTAKAIQKKYKIKYSRQAVRQRAKSYEGDLSERLHQMAIRKWETPTTTDNNADKNPTTTILNTYSWAH